MLKNKSNLAKQDFLREEDIVFSKGPNSLINMIKRKTALKIPDDLLESEVKNLIASGLVVPPYTQQVVASVIQYLFLRFKLEANRDTKERYWRQ